MKAPDDTTVKLLNALETMRAAAYKSFSDRREYEWKFCLSLWSALAFVDTTLLFGATHAQAAFAIAGRYLPCGTLIAAIGVIAAHIWWTKGLARANGIDGKVANELTEKIREALDFEWDSKLKEAMNTVDNTRGTIFHWSHAVEMALTTLLSAVAVAITAIHG